MEKLGLKSENFSAKNYMNPAMELQLVQMTIPEKPKSRNQRYVRR
ncbi:MAG: Fic family protein [Lachnospiraceae bacterium]